MMSRSGIIVSAVVFWAIALIGATGCSDAAPYERDTSGGDICDFLGAACNAAAGTAPAITDLIQTAPDETRMPEGVIPQTSHNNLDIVWFENRLFFAFRTAPTHFASDEVVLYIVSTKDQVTWEFEAKFEMLRDLREPRFMVVNGKLLLYFAVLGYTPVSFEPQYAMVTEYDGAGDWSEPEKIFDDGFIPWRARTIDGVSYLIGYIGGENIYELNGEPIRVYWLKTEDGRTFEPVVPGQPIVLEGGMSETDFAFADDGAVIAVARNEAGDDVNGWGSLICRAEANDLGNWTCNSDRKKYDSPIVFKHESDIYLIGRRNLTEDGVYDLERRDLSPADQTSLYNRTYWTLPKRCSLWKVDQTNLTVEFLFDLPSNGDTCFASVLPLTDKEYLVYNYTSPVGGEDLTWVQGQTSPTLIYRLTLSLP